MILTDEVFPGRYLSTNRYIREAAISEMEALQEQAAQRAYYKPDEQAAARGKEAVNSLLRDKGFLERYFSNDARIRNVAIQEMNQAQYAAHGDAPNSDVEEQPSSAPPAPAPQRRYYAPPPKQQTPRPTSREGLSRWAYDPITS
jgi:hypothetical protein